MAKKTYHGSCHCKKVQFEADIALSKGTGRCNCSYCFKVRNWSAGLKPEDVRIKAKPEDLGKYGFTQESLSHHWFCKNCGVRIGTKGYVEEIGGDYFSVMLTTLDDMNPEELATAPMTFMDGLHDDWFNPPKETRHL